LLNEFDSFESSKNLNEKKEPEKTSSWIPEIAVKPGSSENKSRRAQGEVGKPDEIPFPIPTPFPSADSSRVTHNKCIQSAIPRTWLQLLQRLTRKVGIGNNDAQPVYNDLTSWLLNQGRFSIP